MKKFVTFLLFLFTLLPVSAFAVDSAVEDNAGLFTAEQTIELSGKITELGKQIKGGIFILTTTENKEKPRKFADRSLKERVGKDGNGALLLIDMRQREVYVSTMGNMIDYLTDKRLNHLLDEVQNAMKQQDYFQAGTSFVTLSEQAVKDGVPDGSYRIDEATGKITYYKSLTHAEFSGALGLGLIAACVFFIFIRLRYHLKIGTYRYPYRQNASLHLEKKEDHLVNSFVTTRRIPKPSSNNNDFGGGSTTHSSGGSTFGGGGRSF